MLRFALYSGLVYLGLGVGANVVGLILMVLGGGSVRFLNRSAELAMNTSALFDIPASALLRSLNVGSPHSLAALASAQFVLGFSLGCALWAVFWFGSKTIS